jgi:DNA-3-methyladenine glycosylase II
MPPSPDIRLLGPAHISHADPVMARLIARVGPCRLASRRPRYATLVRAIVGQQLSAGAARSVYGSLRRKVGRHISPEAIARLGVSELAEVGLSKSKATYVHELAASVLSGEIRLDRLHLLDDEDVIERLVRIKGVGRWTAEMFLIFVLNRPDRLPVEDVGLQRGFVRVYGLDGQASAEVMERIAAPWRPYRSVGCWYLWRSLDAAAP